MNPDNAFILVYGSRFLIKIVYMIYIGDIIFTARQFKGYNTAILCLMRC